MNTATALLKPSGKYTVGYADVDLVDESRKCFNFTQGRLVPIRIYFPIDEDSNKLHRKILDYRVPQVFPSLKTETYAKNIDIQAIYPGNFPLVMMNHGQDVAYTDYAILCEDLASHGYVVVSIQHQLEIDSKPPSYLLGRDISKHGYIIENILYVFEWLKVQNRQLFKNKLNLNTVGLIGHSMGGNALLLLANRISDTFRIGVKNLLPRDENEKNVKECIVFLDGEFVYPRDNKTPILFCLSDERKQYQREQGTLDDLSELGHQFIHHSGSKHISYTDHSLVLDTVPNSSERYFNGTKAEVITFWYALREDIRLFCESSLK